MSYSKTFSMLRCYDVCCGGGGLSLGFSQVGAHIIGGIDIDPYAVQTCRKNLKLANWEQINLFDFVAKLRGDKNHVARQANVLLAGLPCQGFSIAGKGNPKDERNYLYVPLLEAVSTIVPDLVVFENVQGILHKRNSAVFQDIRGRFKALGYSVTYRVLNASAFGVAQLRWRLFLVASRPFPADLVFEALERQYQRVTVRQLLKGCPRKRPKPQIGHVFMQHGERVVEKLRYLRPGGPISYRRLDWGTPAFTIISGHRALPVHPSEPRAISPREAARLQGFPDSYLFAGAMSRQIEQVANATPPPVAKEIARAIAKAWSGHLRPKSQISLCLAEQVSDELLSPLGAVFTAYHSRHDDNFPWRNTTNAFHILLAEVLLQRTDRFKAAKVWKELVHTCASARKTSKLNGSDLQPVFKGVGIFSRAETIIELAQTITKFYGGRVPENRDELASLPGVGQYIASAVRVVAFGAQDFPVDSNAFRFVQRYFGIQVHGRKSEATAIRETMKRHVPEGKSREFLFGFLDFMSEICRHYQPDCNSCLLQDSCKSMRLAGQLDEVRPKQDQGTIVAMG